ncbi:MAG: hypothetical protein O3A63_21795, partial [Proteobacteria bacterium]|nr:hypothetical protein [Pseudomonadota bacterium]
HLTDHHLNVGSKLKLTLLNANPLDAQATPTVDVEVKRVTETGVGMAFINKTGAHLWQSVERIRDELAIGRDYFQVRQDIIVVNPDGALLVVQKNGKWIFPSNYLVVGEDWREAVYKTLSSQLGISEKGTLQTVNVISRANEALPEAALVWLTHTCRVTTAHFEVHKDSGYRQAKWIGRRQEVEELTFAVESLRSLAQQTLEQVQADT